MKGVLGIIFSNMHEHLVSELTSIRCMGSIPIGGRYRLVDFALSSMTNSGITEVGVITKSNYQSLLDHLGSGRAWDLSRKQGGLVMLPPFSRVTSGGMYRSRVDALAGVMEYIRASRAEYVLTMDCDMLANMDLRPFFEAHKESEAEISVMYHRAPLPGKANKDTSVLTIGDNGFVTDMLINPQLQGTQDICLNVMVISIKYLEKLLDYCLSRSLYSFERDALQPEVKEGRVFAWKYDGYVSCVDCLSTYFDSNMALLDSDVRRALFPQSRPVYTKVRDIAPARYGLDSKVGNSLIADGCLIEGEVENSVLFRGVTVEKGVKIKNSVVMQGTRVGANSMLDYVISDKNVQIREGRNLSGYGTYPIYIAKGSSI